MGTHEQIYIIRNVSVMEEIIYETIPAVLLLSVYDTLWFIS